MKKPARKLPVPTLTVSDILIERLFQVECAEHGVIDQVGRYSDAIHTRRIHFFEMHKEHR